MRWRTFGRLVVDLAEALGTQMVVTLGALLADVPHSRPVPITGLSSDDALVQRLGLPGSSYEGPTGIVGVLHAACQEAGMPTASLWASVPHYVAAAPNPKAALALVRKLESLVRRDGRRQRARVGGRRLRAPGLARGAERPGRSGFVERLEAAAEEEEPTLRPQDLPSGDVLAREFQRFLRQRGPGEGGGGGPASAARAQAASRKQAFRAGRRSARLMRQRVVDAGTILAAVGRRSSSPRCSSSGTTRRGRVAGLRGGRHPARRARARHGGAARRGRDARPGEARTRRRWAPLLALATGRDRAPCSSSTRRPPRGETDRATGAWAGAGGARCCWPRGRCCARAASRSPSTCTSARRAAACRPSTAVEEGPARPASARRGRAGELRPDPPAHAAARSVGSRRPPAGGVMAAHA
jgi:hypothetical protein